jgi:hypothetical protein
LVYITNTGTAALVLNGSNAVVISGANAADFASNGSTTCTNGLSVAIGSTCLISITFTPSTTTTENATVCLVSNSLNNPDCAVMAGTGTVAVSASPTSLNFGNIYRNKVSSPQTVTFTNNSGGTVTFS